MTGASVRVGKGALPPCTPYQGSQTLGTHDFFNKKAPAGTVRTARAGAFLLKKTRGVWGPRPQAGSARGKAPRPTRTGAPS